MFLCSGFSRYLKLTSHIVLCGSLRDSQEKLRLLLSVWARAPLSAHLYLCTSSGLPWRLLPSTRKPSQMRPLCKWLTVSLGRALSWTETWMVFLWWADAQLTFNAKFSLPLWLSNDSSLNSACRLQTYTTIICPCVLSGYKNVSQSFWGALSKAISFKIKWEGKYRLKQFIICL